MNNKSLPLVSIIIPSYNHGDYLGRALCSVLAQTYSMWEVIIIDNHSLDNTDEVIAGFIDPRIRVYKFHNQGIIGASRNLGIQHAKGIWLAFLDSDDWWMPAKLEMSILFLTLNAGSDLVYHDLFIVSRFNQKYFFKKNKTMQMFSPVFDNLLACGNSITLSSVVVNKEIFIQIGGFSENPDLIAIEDYDAWLRLSEKTDKFLRIPKALGFYWVGGGNTSCLERTVKIINAIEMNYTTDISRISKFKKIWWLDYSRGHLLFSLNRPDNAIVYLKRLNFNEVPLFIYLKSRVILLLVWFLGQKYLKY